MPELFIELFSEEIPARMQAKAADDFSRLVGDALAPLAPNAVRTFYGPRRLAVCATVAAEVAESRSVERGPRRNAPEQALAGFLRKHAANREQLREEGDFLVLEKISAGIDAATLIAREMPPLLRRFPWPKSMRWGGASAFTWVRPLRRITCLLDGAVVKFDLSDGADDGHGLASSNVTEGHRFLSPGPVAVSSFLDWSEKLGSRHVVADAAERRARVAEGVERVAAARQLKVVDDPGLIDEVTGLVEWPVAMIGRIDDAYMDLPAEVMQVSMRVNQRYFALRDASGAAAPWFAFVANIAGADGGHAIVAGNERVLRARFSDARHFWDLDRQRTLESRVAALDGVTFHAKFGSQGDRVRRLIDLAGAIAPLTGADPAVARRAALLAKADLTTGMVGEFPELQGVMGGYYARHDGENDAVADAIRDHYLPKGPSDSVPHNPVSLAVSLADKLDQLICFIGIGQGPTGSGDPFALRRAALGIIRIARKHHIRLRVGKFVSEQLPLIYEETFRNKDFYAVSDLIEVLSDEMTKFVRDRLLVQIRGEGARPDILRAVFDVPVNDRDKDLDIVRDLACAEAVSVFLATDDGANLLAAAKRAANILRIEEKKDGPHEGAVDPALLALPEESALTDALDRIEPTVRAGIDREKFADAMASLATLRPPLDAFFDKVTVNDANPDLRRNRLRLLARVRAAMNLAADFSKIEG